MLNKGILYNPYKPTAAQIAYRSFIRAYGEPSIIDKIGSYELLMTFKNYGKKEVNYWSWLSGNVDTKVQGPFKSIADAEFDISRLINEDSESKKDLESKEVVNFIYEYSDKKALKDLVYIMAQKFIDESLASRYNIEEILEGWKNELR